MATTTRTGWSHALREAWSFRAESNPPGTQGGQDPTAGTPGQDPTKPTMTLEQALEALAATRREAAAHRTEAQALKKAQQEAENAKLSESEKLTKRAAQLEADLEAERVDRRDVINRYEVQLQASRLGIVDPDAAVKLLDWSTVEYREDGSPKNLDAALQALIKARPYLVSPGTPGAGATNPARNHSQGSLTKAQIEAMAPAERRARRAEIMAALPNIR